MICECDKGGEHTLECKIKQICVWFAEKRQPLGAKDEGAIGQFQGKTMSPVYCDEMTLYPESIIDMIDTRLSNPHSMGFAYCGRAGVFKDGIKSCGCKRCKLWMRMPKEEKL